MSFAWVRDTRRPIGRTECRQPPSPALKPRGRPGNSEQRFADEPVFVVNAPAGSNYAVLRARPGH